VPYRSPGYPPQVANEVLGRTNRVFPSVWLSLASPSENAGEGWPGRLVEAALAANTVIDISHNPALWGGQMRGTEACLMSMGGLEIERATETSHATDLVQAHLIETLSAIGRDYIDFYFLRVRRGLEEFQINGALEALEMAKQEGHIRYIGLACDGPSLAVLGLWQFHDAFEVLLVRDDEAYQTLAPIARERRVGIIAPENLVTVRTPEEIEAVVGAVGVSQ